MARVLLSEEEEAAVVVALGAEVTRAASYF